MNRIVICVCVVLVTASATIILSRFGLLKALPAAISVFCICVAAILFVRQARLSHELSQERARHTTMPAPDGTLPSEESIVARPANTSAYMAPREVLSSYELEPEHPHSDVVMDEADVVMDEELDTSFQLEAEPYSPIEPEQPAPALNASPTDLVMYLQPVVSTTDMRATLFEAQFHLRLPDGAELEPAQYARIAETKGLIAGIDRHALVRSLHFLNNLPQTHSDSSLICCVSPSSFTNLDSFEQLFSTLRRHEQAASRLTLALRQRSFIALGERHHARLKAVADLCHGLMLDDVLDFRVDVVRLTVLGFRYVRMPGTIFLHADAGLGSAGPADLLTALGDYSVEMIVNEVERDADKQKLADRGVAMAQGSAFAPPRRVKDDGGSATHR